VTDVFDTVYSVVLQMLSRVMGATEVSEDPRHRARLLSAFEMLEASASTAGVIFPWLPTMFTPSWARRLVIGAALYRTFSSIIQTRQNTDRREDDALQDLLDQKTPLSDNIQVRPYFSPFPAPRISELGDSPPPFQFQASIIFVGLLTTSVGSGWLLIMLVSHPQWQARCRDEVDRVVSAHRRSADQAAGDVLGDLPLQVWESEFPVLDACLREVTRLSVVSAVFRKNTSGRDLPIGDTGEVIPAGSYATYVFDDVHQDEGLYPDAGAFNPGRYLDGERRGAKGEPHTHVGWGSGLHLCRECSLSHITLPGAYLTYLAGLLDMC
jgi:sterol 14-demethylase